MSGEWVIECHSCSCELTGFTNEQEAWKRWSQRSLSYETAEAAVPAKDIALSLRELADKLPTQPVHLGLLQQALRGGAAEIEQLCSRAQPHETPSRGLSSDSGMLVCYTPCKAHMGLPFTLRVGYAPPPKSICPVCHPPDVAGPNIRHEGGVPVCGWCGFAMIVEGPRQCCPQGIAWDRDSTYLLQQEPEGRLPQMIAQRREQLRVEAEQQEKASDSGEGSDG